MVHISIYIIIKDRGILKWKLSFWSIPLGLRELTK